MMDLKGKSIAVTGASGFLGGYVVDVLRARGAKVVGVVRNPLKVPDLAERCHEIRKADLMDPPALKAAFTGMDAVVHTAALYSLTKGGWEENFRPNQLGTEHTFEALREAEVRRVVHISTVGVYRRQLGYAHEDDPKLELKDRFTAGAYRTTKALSEALAWRLSADYGLDLTVLRPSGIYGAHDPNFMPLVRRLTRLPLMVVPKLVFPFVYAKDVAEAAARALECEVSVGEAYNTAGEARSTWEFFEAWKEASGKGPALALPLPLPARIAYDNGKAFRDLGWQNSNLVESLREVFAVEPA
ncbi:NAD-dependent epimerase/dehydratase family protein [bacterium]|nr:NAD-dependent epimerase/dehydratase family protein [bacterium]